MGLYCETVVTLYRILLFLKENMFLLTSSEEELHCCTEGEWISSDEDETTEEVTDSFDENREMEEKDCFTSVLSVKKD